MSPKNRYMKTRKEIENQNHTNRHINFGVVMYFILMAYLVFIIWHSMTRVDIHFVYAEEGVIHEDGEFTGLIIRNEQVIKSDDSGDIKYFVPEGSKVRQDSYVCAINQDPILEQQINDSIQLRQNQLTEVSETKDYTIIKAKIKDYILEKNSYDISYTYSSKDLLETTLNDMAKTVYIEDEELFQQIQHSIATSESEQLVNGTYYRMLDSGVVSYTIDGFESTNLDNFTPDLFKQSVSITNASEKVTINEGDPLYKVVDNYLFYIVAKMNPRLSKHLDDKNYVTLYFPKKNISIDVLVSDYIYIGEDDYVVFSIDRYFDDFFNDRFIDFKVLYQDYAGLKVPNASVTTKELIKVPQGSTKLTEGRLTITKLIASDEDTTHESTETIPVKIYYEDDIYSYIGIINNTDTLYFNDRILYRPNDDDVVKMEEYIIDYPIKVEGVYTINYGYADFKRISTIYENDSYRIIDPYTKYSVTAYDRIVSDASKVNEFATLNE